MKKNTKFVVGLYGFIILVLLAGPVFAYPIGSPVEITTDTESMYYSFEQDIYKVGDTLFCFYSSYSDDGLYYATSTNNGTSWTENGRISDSINAKYNDVYTTHYDGNYFYYAIAETTTDLNFRRGILNENETITWSASVQHYTNSLAMNRPFIISDSNNYTYVAFSDTAGTDYFRVVKNGNNDGTWSTASGYPKQLAQGLGAISLNIDSNDTVYITMYDNTGGNFTLQTLNTSNNTLSSETIIDTTLAGFYYFSAIHDQNDTLRIVYNKNSNVYFNSYNLTDGLDTKQSLGTCQSDSVPMIVFDLKTYDFYVSWFESAVYFIQYDYSAGEFQTEVQGSDSLADISSNSEVQSAKTNNIDSFYWAFVDSAGDWYYLDMQLDPTRTLPVPETEIDTIVPWDLTPIVIFLVGSIMMVAGPVWLALNRTPESFVHMFILTAIGLSLVLAYIYW